MPQGEAGFAPAHQESDRQRADHPAATNVRALFRRFWPFIRAERASLLVSAVLLVLSVAADTAGIYMFMLLTDQALATGSVDAFWHPAISWLGIAVIGATTSFFGSYLAARAAEKFLLRLRGHVFHHVQELSPHFYARHQLGDLVSRMSGDIDAVERLVGSGVLQAVTSVVSVVVYAGAALYLRWDLALLSFALAPAFWAISRRFSRTIKHAAREERSAYGAISTVVSEGLSNIALVQAYNQQGRQDQRLHREASRWFGAKLAVARTTALYQPLVTVVETVSILLVIGVGVWEISAQRITIGGLMAFAAYIGFLYPPLQSLGQITMSVTAARAASERLIELLAEQPAVDDRHAAALALPARRRRAVEFRQTRFQYPGADRPAVTDLRLKVDAGEFVMVTGRSGAGKSTLAKLLLRFYDPVAGRVLLDGVDLAALGLHTVRDTIALVPQETAVFHGTVAENIAFGAPEATRDEIIAAAREADADGFVRELPEGYDTVLGERGERLSGGQRRRITIARAVLRRPAVLVLDEPTNGLDTASTRKVVEPLRQLARTRTTILISHDLSLAPEVDRVVVLEGGRVVEQGSHQRLLAHGGHYADLHRQRASGTSRLMEEPTPDRARPIATDAQRSPTFDDAPTVRFRLLRFPDPQQSRRP